MNKLVKNGDTRCRHNEAKYKILSTLFRSRRYILPRKLAQLTGLTEGGVRTRLSKMYVQGHIWRKICRWKGENGYMYRYLKPMGYRVYIELERRMKIREVTGVNISLNWKKRVPPDVLNECRKAIMR